MFKLIEQHGAAIAAVCRKYRVAGLELFGSATRGDFRQGESDLEFFVEFAPPDAGVEEWRGSFKRYAGLKLDLEDLLDRPLDLIEPKSVANPYFAQVANQFKALVYAA